MRLTIDDLERARPEARPLHRPEGCARGVVRGGQEQAVARVRGGHRALAHHAAAGRRAPGGRRVVRRGEDVTWLHLHILRDLKFRDYIFTAFILMSILSVQLQIITSCE